MKKIISIFLCFIFFVSSTYGVWAKEEIKDSDILAKSAVVIDGETGRVLYGKDCEKKMAMASTTKIMTCIVALENSEMEKVVEVSNRAVNMPKVHMNIRKGEKYYMKDLLHAMMLESYNDVAVAVAEGVAGSVENFAAMMNKKAKEIGATNTHFVTPNGLDADEHYSTAHDMAIIGAYAVKNKDFLEITNTKSYSLSDLSGKRNFNVSNKDAFLTMDSNAIGIKTGFTGEAGYCFVGAVNSEDRVFVSCVLACGWPPNKTYKWKDTQKLMNYGKENYNYKELLNENAEITVKIDKGTKGKIKAYVEGKSNFLVSQNEKSNITTKIKYKLPIKENDVIGQTEIFIDEKPVQTRNILAKESVEKYDFMYCLKKVFGYFIFQ